MKPLPSLPEGRRKTIRMATLSLGEVRRGFILHSSLKLILPHSFSGVRNFLAYSSNCRLILSARYSIAQIAGCILSSDFWCSANGFIPLLRSLKHSGALLGSNFMRNRTAQIDRNGQESLSTRLLLFHSKRF